MMLDRQLEITKATAEILLGKNAETMGSHERWPCKHQIQLV